MPTPLELSPTDTLHLKHAIQLSHEARSEGNEPYGAVLVSAEGEVLGIGKNELATRNDPLSHAESNAIREAAQSHGNKALAGATMYASGEPCAMCAAACFNARISRIVFALGASTIRDQAPANRPRLELGTHEVAARGTPKMTVEGPVAEEEALRAFEGFFD